MTIKQRLTSVFLCAALIVSISVVRPPKAEAIAFEAGIAVPIILAVAIASGITFLSEGMTESGLTEYIGRQLQQYVTDIGTTVSDWWDGLGTLGKNDSGQVVLAPPFYRGVQQFLSWWKGHVSLTDGVSNLNLVTQAATVDGYKICPLDVDVSDWAKSHPEFCYSVSTSTINIDGHAYSWDETGRTFYQDGVRYGSILNQNAPYFVIRNTGASAGYDNNLWIISLNAQKNWVTARFNFHIGTAASSSLSASQTASYDALELQDDESVALDLGATVDAGATLEDILAEYLAKIVDNTATAAQEVTTESGEGEGDEDDETAPYLPFIPRIWEKLQGLPDDIADKVHDLFVPSAAFVEALPAEFADVFDSRCGLLTYPAALLADFLTRLATLTAQEPILRWGNIKEPFSDRQLIAAGSYNLNSAIQTEAMQTVYNVYMICVKAAVAFWFVELCKRKYEKIIRS